jgi:heme/copper-type cytochrome/quinol oxidase subunit 2
MAAGGEEARDKAATGPEDPKQENEHSRALIIVSALFFIFTVLFLVFLMLFIFLHTDCDPSGVSFFSVSL